MANIQGFIDKIRTAIYGKEVRGSLADGLDAVNKETEATSKKQGDLEATFDQLIINAGDSNAEIVASRHDSVTGETYDTLPKRLDAASAELANTEEIQNEDNQQTTLFFLQNLEKIRTRQILSVQGFYSFEDNVYGKYRVLSVTGEESWLDIRDDIGNTLFQISDIGELRGVGSSKKLKVMPKNGKSDLKLFGARGDSVYDDGIFIQRAINSFNPTNTTWSVSKIGVVLIPYGDFLNKSELKIREGVFVEGSSKYGSRLRFDFSSSKNGITNEPIAGQTFTKNFGFRNLSFLPDYNKPGVAGIIFMNFKEAIEPYIHDCRFIMHKGAVGGGQLDASGIKLDKCQHVDFDNIVFDGGKIGIQASGTDWGVQNGRIRNLFFYNQMNRGMVFNNSKNNTVSNIFIEQLQQEGDNIGFELDSTSVENTINGLNASGSKLRYGLVVHSAKNTMSAIMVKEALVQKIYITDPENTINTGLFCNPEDRRTALNEHGKQILKTSPFSLSSVNTWQTVANVRLGSNGTGVYVTAHISDQVEGVGRQMLKKGWFIERGTGACTAAENTTDKFSNGTALEFQWVTGATNNDMNLQVRFIAGTAVNDTFVILEMNGGSVNDLLRNGAS